MPDQYGIEIPQDELDFVAARTKPASTPTAIAPDRDLPTARKPIAIDWGSATRLKVGDGLDRLKPDQGKAIRFAVLPGQPIYQETIHFLTLAGQSKRPYICGGEGCPACAAGGEGPKLSVVCLALQYLNADAVSAKLANDTEPIYKVGYLALSVSNYNAIVDGVEEGSRPSDVDYRMSYDGKRFDFHVISSKARYIARGDQARILAMAKPLTPLLRNKMGSPLPANASLSLAPPMADLDD